MAQAPSLNQTSKGAIGFTQALIDQRNGVWLLCAAGSPTDGTSGTGATFADTGSLYIDITDGKLHINTNTKASPTWVVVGSQS